MKLLIGFCLFTVMILGSGLSANAAPDQVKTKYGTVEGTGKQASGVRMFLGIPYAAPPVGEMRWKPPGEANSWSGVKQTVQFGARCMQHPVFGDMNFRANGMSEDCLFLNVWTPANSANEKLPVMVYFYGGGFIAGDGSEPRYDGESLAAKGVVVVTLNYRLGIYGFYAHPDLAKESPKKAAGNYGLLDQAAAIRWVSQNIAAFGGDAKKITIGGESAGSISVSAQMVSPLSKKLIHGAIGESGSILSALPAVTLAEAATESNKFTNSLGVASLAAMRALTTEQLQQATSRAYQFRFPITVDGYFLTEPPATTYAAGKQARVPLLVGWNSEEMTWRALMGGEQPTAANYEKVVRKLYPLGADDILRLYPAKTDAEVIQAATDLAGDRFIAFSTWKWFDMHTATGRQPVYRYYFSRPRPGMTAEFSNATPGLAGGVVKNSAPNPNAPPPATGAVHSAEIEYAFGNLPLNKVYAWTPDDFKVSKTMQDYFANFIKTGNPNGNSLPSWTAAKKGTPVSVMRIDVDSRSEADKYRERYVFLDRK